MRKSYCVEETGLGFFVRDSEETRVSRVFRTLEEAQAEEKRLYARAARANLTELRSCLCCGTMFLGQGPFNRLCEICKAVDGPPKVDWRVQGAANAVSTAPDKPARRIRRKVAHG